MNRKAFKHIKTKEQFIIRSNEKHSNFYDYSLVEFKDRGCGKSFNGNLTRKLAEYYGKAYVTINCPKHGPFVQQCRKHLEGSGCHECARKKIASALAGRESTIVFKKKYFNNTLELSPKEKDKIKAALASRQLLEEKCITKKFIIESPKHGHIEVLIDKKDWKRVSKYTWSVSKCHKGRDGQVQFYINSRLPLPDAPRYNYTHPILGYQRTYMRTKNLALARFIVNAPEGKVVDHINGNTHDNRRHNLRICSYTDNAINSRSKIDTEHDFKGISKNTQKTNPWTTYIKINKKTVNLGSYATKEDAAKVYDVMALKNYGEFAYLNFPIENYLNNTKDKK
tara:strand:+ start:67 stop:1080 length:1014 start_codon:yes stop_codon:yes gene_type:complete